MANSETIEQKKWNVVSEKDVLSVPWFSVSVQEVELPSGRRVDDYYQINCPDAVVMVAQTEDDSYIIARQYLHGFRDVSMVFPSGTVGEGEDALTTAKRELLEETGYSGGAWQSLGRVPGHSSYGCGYVHFYRCRGAKVDSTPVDNDDLEDIEVVLLSETEVQMQSAWVIFALWGALLHSIWQ